jgi:hypothetical protein
VVEAGNLAAVLAGVLAVVEAKNLAALLAVDWIKV